MSIAPGALIAGQAAAQDAEPVPAADAPASPADQNEGVKDIIVTARKTTERLIDVPVAATAISGDDIQKQGLTDLNRIAQMVPQLVVAQSASSTGASFSIRGIGTSSQDPGLDQSVAVVLDGTNILRGQIVGAAMFDLAQVEVLKGPQALFFGKNSPAGVISLTSAGATDTLTGYVRTGYEFDAHEVYGDAAISGPLSPTLKGRIAVHASTMRGWLKNLAVPTTGSSPYLETTPGAIKDYAPGTKEFATRGTLTWTPSDRFDATVKAMYANNKDNGGTAQYFCDNAPVTLGGLVDTALDCKFDNTLAYTGIDPRYISPDWAKLIESDGAPYNKVRTYLGNLTANYRMGAVTLTSVTSYYNLRYRQGVNYDRTSYGLIWSATRENTDVFGEELRLISHYDGPLNFTVGGYYEDVHRETGAAPLVLNLGPDPANGNYFTTNSSAHTHTTLASGFGQLRWKLADTLELAGGVRYTHEKRDFSIQSLYRHPVGGAALGIVPVGIVTEGDALGTNWSPELTLTYKPAPDTMFYAAYKTGYKAGGFGTPYLFQINSATGQPTSASDLAYGPEHAKGGEIGFKLRIDNRRLQIEGAIYNYTFKDLQLSVFNPASFSYTTKNAASARTRGIEISTIFQPTRDLQFFVNGSYNQAIYTNYATAQCYVGQTAAQGCLPVIIDGVAANAQNFTGRHLERAPKFTFSGGFSYDTPVSNDWNLGLNGDVDYKSGYDTDPTKDPFSHQHGFARLNAGVRLHTADDRYEIAFIGRNLTNKYYVELSSAAAFANSDGQFGATTPRARELRVQLGYKF